jgi:two-component system phosphate regulon sensor histidine kinase PhoR
MREIVDDLLELSRLEATAEEAPHAVVDMPALLERLAQEARAAAVAPPSIGLELDRRLLLKGSDTELHSIAWNLIWNAVKYTPTSGTVTIRWRRDGHGALLQVQDDGIGIAPEHLPRLTERFYRVDVASSREKGGTGLGLAIVKHIVAHHRGLLDIRSTEGKGTTFSVVIPAAPAQVPVN